MRVRYSSAEYLQSNGALDSVVKILKRLQKVSATKQEFFRAMLYLQGQAKRCHTASPTQIFLGRTVCTPLAPHVEQSTVTWARHLLERQRDQNTMKHYFDRTALGVARDFGEGDKVLVHNVRGRSVPGTVVGATDGRTYLVEFHNWSHSIRNRRFLTFLPSRDEAPNDMCPAVYQPPGANAAARIDPAAVAATPTDAEASTSALVRPGSSLDTETSPTTTAPRATGPVPGTVVPRQNPSSPPQPVIGTTQSGRPVVPTLKGLGR